MKKFLFWFLAVVITLAAAVYQRLTGPTYPVRGRITLDDSVIKYELPRSANTEEDCQINIKVSDADISGFIEYKKFKTQNPWVRIPFSKREDRLIGNLPRQPVAGKLTYRIILSPGGKDISLTGDSQVIIRFRRPVPLPIIIFHASVMFLAMLFSTRAGLEALDRNGNPKELAQWAAAFLFIGGFILGPIVEKLAFGVFWTGFPVGMDLTDNKTLIALLGWIVALIAGRGRKPARGWILAAAILLLIVYSIPHSLHGS